MAIVSVIRWLVVLSLNAQEVNFDLASEPILVMVDAWGKKIEGLEIALQPLEPRGKSAPINWRPGLRLRAGSYDLSVSGKGVSPWKARVKLPAGKVEIVVCGRLGRSHFANANPVNGRIDTPDGSISQCNRLTVTPLYCPQTDLGLSVPVYQNGFVLDDLEPGYYLFSLFKDLEYCFTKTVDIRWRPGQVIRLREREPSR